MTSPSETHRDSGEDSGRDPTRREQQRRDQDLVEFGKGSGLEDLKEEQKEQSQRKRNNKLKSDDVKHH